MVFDTSAALLIHHWVMFVLNQAVHQALGNHNLIIIIIITIIVFVFIIITIFRQNMLQFYRQKNMMFTIFITEY